MKGEIDMKNIPSKEDILNWIEEHEELDGNEL